MTGTMMELTDQDFAGKVLESELPVVVDFWAPWCGPCKMLTPLLEELAAQYAGKLTFAKMDIAKHPETAARYGIRSIPALLFFKAGKVAATITGAVPKNKIQNTLDKVLQ